MPARRAPPPGALRRRVPRDGHARDIRRGGSRGPLLGLDEEQWRNAVGLAGIIFDPLAVVGDGLPSPVGCPEAPGIVRDHLHGRAATIYGGSNEIQRNIIAKAVLGLVS